MRFHIGCSFRLKSLTKFLIPIALGILAYFGFGGLFGCITVKADSNYNSDFFINYDENEFGGITSPYLTSQTGLFYKDFDELSKILDEYIEQQQVFLEKFTPQKWTIENMSDKSTVQELLKLLGI